MQAWSLPPFPSGKGGSRGSGLPREHRDRQHREGGHQDPEADARVAQCGPQHSAARLGFPLIARGGVEPYGGQVLAAAGAAGLRVIERQNRPGVLGMLDALAGTNGADVVVMRSPLDPESRGMLFQGAATVLANSAHEPFGLVGLETMAVGGLACTGCSGEDYAMPGQNALVLQTANPDEFLALFGPLQANPTRESAIRRAARTTAKQYMWRDIIEQNILPRIPLFHQ